MCLRICFSALWALNASKQAYTLGLVEFMKRVKNAVNKFLKPKNVKIDANKNIVEKLK